MVVIVHDRRQINAKKRQRVLATQAVRPLELLQGLPGLGDREARAKYATQAGAVTQLHKQKNEGGLRV